MKDQELALSLCFLPGHESLNLNDLPPGHLIMIPVDPQADAFSFPATMAYKDTDGQSLEKQLAVCMDNSESLQFQVTRSFADFLKATLCEEPFSCARPEDLREFKGSDMAVELKMEGKIINNASLKDDKSISVAFAYEDLYSVDADGNLTFAFREFTIEQSERNCQFILQKSFWKGNYLHVLRDFSEENDSFFVTFREVEDKQFEKAGGALATVLVFCIVFAICLALYILYDCIKRFRGSRAQEEEEYEDEEEEEIYERIKN